MQAVINASDEGVRLRPLSCVRNGALLDIGGLTILEHTLRLLSKSGVTKVIIMCTYMPEGVEAYLNGIDSFGMELYFVKGTFEEATGGIDEDFIYVSKCIYTEADIKNVIAYHKSRRAFVSIAIASGVKDGIVSDSKGKVTRIEEGRIWESVSGQQGVGIYVLNPMATEYITKGELNHAALSKIIRSGKSVYIKMLEGVCESGENTASYMRACFAFLDEMKKTAAGGICVAEGAIVEKGALLEVPCYVGKGAHIHKGAKVGAYSLIGEGTVVSEGASIKRSIIAKDCRIGACSALRGCFLDEEVHLGSKTTVYEQAIIGRRCSIGSDVLIKSFVKIWPEKTIEKGVIVSENIMWGQKKRSRLFEDGRIKGVVNVDITPLFATLLGSVAGRVFNMGEVGLSTDDSASGAMLRDAIGSALSGAGCRIKDFGEQPLPITRRAVAFYSMEGAICISTHPDSGEEIAEITILGKNGFDIDKSTACKLEELFEKGDIVYPEAKNIQECQYVFEYKLYYLKSIVDYQKDNRKGKKVLLSCKATWGRRLITSALADFGCSVSIYDGDYDSKEGRAAFADMAQKGGFDVGFIMDNRCEKLYVAHKGEIMSEDVYEALCSLIVMKKHTGAKIYVPVTASEAVDALAKKHDCTTVRTKSTPLELMRHMAGSERYLTEQFIFRFDAVGSVILIMDFVTGSKESLSALKDEIPPIAMEKSLVRMPDASLGEVMDRIYSLPASSDAAEGVKITFDKGWVVVIPDMEKEVFTVVGEGVSMEAAHELCDICIKKIRNE